MDLWVCFVIKIVVVFTPRPKEHISTVFLLNFFFKLYAEWTNLREFGVQNPQRWTIDVNYLCNSLRSSHKIQKYYNCEIVCVGSELLYRDVAKML